MIFPNSNSNGSKMFIWFLHNYSIRMFSRYLIPIILITKKEFGGELTRDINLLYFACLPNILVLYRISLILLRSEEVMRNIDIFLVQFHYGVIALIHIQGNVLRLRASDTKSGSQPSTMVPTGLITNYQCCHQSICK